MQKAAEFAGCPGPHCLFTENQTREHLAHHVKARIPTKIRYAQIGLLPRRNSVQDQNMRTAFAGQVKKGAPLLFMPTTVEERTERYTRGTPAKTSISMIGVLPDGSKTMVILDNIDIVLDVRVPAGIKPAHIEDFARGLASGYTYSKYEQIRRYPLKGFSAEQHPYIRYYFTNLYDRRSVIDRVAEVNAQIERDSTCRFGTVSFNAPIETASDDQGAIRPSGSDYYFPRVARESKFHTADWNRIEKYELLESNWHGVSQGVPLSSNCAYVLRVDMSAKPPPFTKLTKEQRRNYSQPDNLLCDIIDKDPTMVMQWDIETYSRIQNGVIPTPGSDYTIFMINSAYFWHHSDEPLLTVCCVDMDMDPHSCEKAVNNPEQTLITVVCGNERNVLLCHLAVVAAMSPEISAAFNGSNFDWPLFRDKITRAGLLTQLYESFSSRPITPKMTSDYIEKFCFASQKVKIDAENKHECKCVAQFSGMLDTDVLPVFLKLYTRMEVRKAGSLNFFLAKNGLSSKEDMHYKRMFRIYERALEMVRVTSCHCNESRDSCRTCTATVKEIDYKPAAASGPSSETEYTMDLHDDLRDAAGNPKCCFCGKKPRNLRDMAEVGLYCTVDCIRPQQLYVKRTIVPDKRELSTMSCVSLRDSFYLADGMKVRNLIGKYSAKLGIAFSNSRVSHNEKDHYPGAKVIVPERGLNNTRPITGLDFASLYPSLMMTYNLSPDMVVYDAGRAGELSARGYSIHHVAPFQFERGEKKGQAGNKRLTAEGWTVRHNGIFNAKKDTRVVERYQKYETFTLTDGQKITRNINSTYRAEPNPPPPPGVVSRRFGYEPVYGRDPLPGERMGIFPFIVKKLFDKRVPIKAEFVRLSKLKEQLEAAGKKQTDGARPMTMKEINFQINKVDSKQKALKVLANTFYGESGNYLSSVYELIVAAGITCAGQMSLTKVVNFVSEKSYGVKYGDSVTGDTPVLCRLDGVHAFYIPIEDICRQQGIAFEDYQRGPDTKQSFVPRRLEAWTETGWTAIHRVIRHKTRADIYRVATAYGCVDVTEDHSLLDESGARVRPRDLNTMQHLLHASLPHKQTHPDVQRSTSGRVPDKIGAAVLFHFCYDLGLSPSVEIDGDGYRIVVGQASVLPTRVRVISNLGPCGPDQWVYDLETENHHFAAGIGRLIVHNTDSAYIVCPEECFAATDIKYNNAVQAVDAEFAGVARVTTRQELARTTDERVHAYKKARTAARIAYWTEMVDISMRVMNNLKEEVSDYLLWDNGTCFLNMAYEEVGFPTVLCGKKKYYMTPHIERINFYPKDLFIRGIDIIKQGQAGISKKLGMEFMKESLSPENESELIELAECKIRELYATYGAAGRDNKMTADLTLFTMSGRYKPDKQNIPVLTFVDRMKSAYQHYRGAGDNTMAALYEPPEPGDKFDYVIVEKTQQFTTRGARIVLKKGDRMEYVRVFVASQSSRDPMKIDLSFYVKNMIIGIFARFIAYHPRFQPPAGTYDVSDKEQYRKLDESCVKGAQTYLEQLSDSITGYDSKALTQLGRDYRSAYTRASKALRNDLAGRYGSFGDLLAGGDPSEDADGIAPDPAATEDTRQVRAYIEKVKTDATVPPNVEAGKRMVAYLGERSGLAANTNVYVLSRIYNGIQGGANRTRGIAPIIFEVHKAAEAKIIDAMMDVVPTVLRIARDRELAFDRLIRESRQAGEAEMSAEAVEALNTLAPEDEEKLRRMEDLTYQLRAVYKLRRDLQDFIAAIGEIKASKIDDHAVAIDARAASRADAKSTPLQEDYTWK